jgi:hypothetical protein
MFGWFFEGERVRTPEGEGAEVIADTNGAELVPVMLDDGRLHEYMTYELSRLGIPA